MTATTGAPCTSRESPPTGMCEVEASQGKWYGSWCLQTEEGWPWRERARCLRRVEGSPGRLVFGMQGSGKWDPRSRAVGAESDCRGSGCCRAWVQRQVWVPWIKGSGVDSPRTKRASQWLDPHHSSDPSHRSGNTGSLTHCPTRDLPGKGFFNPLLKFELYPEGEGKPLQQGPDERKSGTERIYCDVLSTQWAAALMSVIDVSLSNLIYQSWYQLWSVESSF